MSGNKFYRADIDGLRAIAVTIVILFHAGFTWIKGGYVGVDVFFVISGFLITKSINKEMSEGSFSFKSFYLRRIRRIIPVLVFVMAVVTVPAYIFFFANDLENYSRTVLHTILSTNNFHLWIKGKNYFVENTELIPLLHTWSLSVEEQFYIIWPPILLLMHRVFSLKNRLIFIVIFILGGLGLSIYLAHNYALMAYFLLPSRLFEMSLGAGLALFWDKIPVISKTNNNILSFLGTLLIVVPAIFLQKTSVFPGFNALWPCLGAVLIILAGKNNDSKGVVNSLLSIRPIVFVGLLSYSMYLWHWPIFVFIKYLGIQLNLSIALLAIALTLLLSYFSWKYVEKPFRYKFKYDFSKTLLIVLLPCLAITGTIYGVIDAKNGFPDRFPELSEFDKRANFPNKVRRNCFDAFRIGNCEECFLGVKKDKLDGVLIGDSFANHSAAFIDVLAKDAGLYLHDSAAGGYPLLYDVDDASGQPEQSVDYGLKRLAYAKKFDLVVIASNWERHYNKESKNYQLVINTIQELITEGKKIVIIDPMRSTDEMSLHKMKMFKVGNLPKSIKKEDLLIPFYNRPEGYIINEVKRKFPQIEIIDFNKIMCDADYCSYDLENIIVYRNGNHLNTSGATLMGEKYLKEIGNPLKKLLQSN